MFDMGEYVADGQWKWTERRRRCTTGSIFASSSASAISTRSLRPKSSSWATTFPCIRTCTVMGTSACLSSPTIGPPPSAFKPSASRSSACFPAARTRSVASSHFLCAICSCNDRAVSLSRLARAPMIQLCNN